VDATLDDYLHMPQNAAIHQKSLSKILSSLSQIVSKIIVQGIALADLLEKGLSAENGSFSFLYIDS